MSWYESKQARKVVDKKPDRARIRRTLLRLAAEEQEVIVLILRQIQRAERRLARLFADIAADVLRKPELEPLLEVIRLKQEVLAGKIFNLATKEAGLADIIAAVKALKERKLNKEFLRLAAKELRVILRMLEDILEEEKELFDLFLDAVRQARQTKPVAVQLAQEIAFKQSVVGLKLGALGIKQMALADKIRAAAGLEPKHDTIEQVRVRADVPGLEVLSS